MKMSPAVLALLAVLLPACSELQPFTGGFQTASVPVEDCGINTVMRDLHGTRAMGEEKLQQTLGLWEKEYQINPSDSNGLRLALLYAAGDQSVRDTARAQKLLAEVAASVNDSGERELAYVLHQLLDEQTDAYRKINLLNKSTAELNKRIRELEQQQRALMNIEQKIQERNTSPVTDDGQ
jgi:hypothetical protein